MVNLDKFWRWIQWMKQLYDFDLLKKTLPGRSRPKNSWVQPDPITENAICNNNSFSMISVVFVYQCVRGVWRHGVRAVRHAVRPPVHPWGHGVHQSVGIRLPFPARPHLLRTQGINDFRLLIRQSIRLCGLFWCWSKFETKFLPYKYSIRKTVEIVMLYNRGKGNGEGKGPFKKIFLK